MHDTTQQADHQIFFILERNLIQLSWFGGILHVLCTSMPVNNFGVCISFMFNSKLRFHIDALPFIPPRATTAGNEDFCFFPHLKGTTYKL